MVTMLPSQPAECSQQKRNDGKKASSKWKGATKVARSREESVMKVARRRQDLREPCDSAEGEEALRGCDALPRAPSARQAQQERELRLHLQQRALRLLSTLQ